jgi:hypothetical protein
VFFNAFEFNRLKVWLYLSRLRDKSACLENQSQQDSSLFKLLEF